ncbi:sugar ABC transporter substrate-binding protein [Neobacillus niacini]|uniref:sugar ABC transporter substrate-binding protein n=1 Tax=Neobacillus niacini TaxID=86668 RepID=UPI0007AB8445|nr:sugar ABC transporter substrate-binding protein [Neobacillus niacini]MEC1525174.1 sugar ABC transporter substrate-binding protein [Neobacillus niacini]
MTGKWKMIVVVGTVLTVIVLGFISVTFADKKPTVVVVLKASDSPYWNIMKAGIEKGFKDFGIDGKVMVPSEAIPQQQVELLKNIYKEKPDLIITAPYSSSAVGPTLETFTDIPILLVDTNIPIENKTAYIGTNNLDLGKKAGAFLASQLQPGDKIAIIGGDLSFSVFKERVEGATISLQNAGINIAYKKTGIPDNPKKIQSVITKLMRDQPDIKGVMTTHDTIALPVIKELEEQGLLIPVIGPDGLADMVKLIADGTLPGTTAQNPYDMGYLSVETAMKVLKGENVDPFVDSGVDIIIKENANSRLNFYEKLVK